jgi:hypothetical protein
MNFFINNGNWSKSDVLNKVSVVIGEISETTSDFTRNKNPNKRYWKASVSFKHEQHTSPIIKFNKAGVPYYKSTNYGTSYVYAMLQPQIAHKIVDAGLAEKGIKIDASDPKISGTSDQWYLTINKVDNNIGVISSNGTFTSKNFAAILQKTEQGAYINFDIYFSLKCTVDGTRDRNAHDTWRIAADCSRGAIIAIREDIPLPIMNVAVPQQKASKEDIAPKELVDELEQLQI